MTLSAKERLKRFYAQFNSDDHVLIPINADPDAIASAMAAKRLLWRKTANVTIANINEIKRPDNLTLIRLIGVALVPIAQVDPARFNRVLMVDSQPDHHQRLMDFSPHAIIDHHPISSASRAPFLDIRPKYGATATIFIEYLRAARIKPSTKLATALYYAIKTDTSNFERQTQMEDLNAFQFVFRHSNIAMARRIEFAEMRRDFLPYFRKALNNYHIGKGRAFVYLGEVMHPDVCVQIADFFMRIEAVNRSMVAGLHDDKLIVIFRNDGIRKNAGQEAKAAFASLGSAGGHASAARAEIPLAALAQKIDLKETEKFKRWVRQRINRRAARAGK